MAFVYALAVWIAFTKLAIHYEAKGDAAILKGDKTGASEFYSWALSLRAGAVGLSYGVGTIVLACVLDGRML